MTIVTDRLKSMLQLVAILLCSESSTDEPLRWTLELRALALRAWGYIGDAGEVTLFQSATAHAVALHDGVFAATVDALSTNNSHDAWRDLYTQLHNGEVCIRMCTHNPPARKPADGQAPRSSHTGVTPSVGSSFPLNDVALMAVVCVC